jgi:hypothetical protein
MEKLIKQMEGMKRKTKETMSKKIKVLSENIMANDVS